MIIGIVGLGYVGAPLAVTLAKKYLVIGYDINDDRVDQLSKGIDHTGEIDPQLLKTTTVTFTSVAVDLRKADVIIVTVPTPVGEANVPDLSAVKAATEMVGANMQQGAIVVFESTVYPGVTEEICVPILEKASGFTWKDHFNVGYSPERINPGDKVNTLTTTTKIVSGDTEKTGNILELVYGQVCPVYRAPNIKVAEAAKVIENTQRDVNIALMNELSQIFTRLGVDTNDVINAAASKWNFQPFRPGLVGGHCISVDPYYLSHKAATKGFIADVILSSREVNDSMASFVADQLVKMLARNRMLGATPVVTIIGATFKENVTDIRNSKIFAVMEQLRPYGIIPQLIDSHADAVEVKHEYDVEINPKPLLAADAILLAVPHSDMVKTWDDVVAYGKGPNHKLVVMDLKAVLDRNKKPEFVDLWRP